MAAASTLTATLASAAIRAEPRTAHPASRSTHIARDASPAATHDDRMRSGIVAPSIADRILAETWGWS